MFLVRLITIRDERAARLRYEKISKYEVKQITLGDEMVNRFKDEKIQI
jgi:hypothetical protein